MLPPSPPRRALRAVLRRAERSVPVFAALVLGLGAVGALGLLGASVGSLWMQVAGVVAFGTAGGCVLALAETPWWLRLAVLAGFFAPTLAMVAVVGPRFSASFDGPPRVVIAERILPLPLSRTGCAGLFRYTAEGETFTRVVAHSPPCWPVHPVQYVAGAPGRIRSLPASLVRRSGRPAPPPPEPVRIAE